jgi:hypothetical protein
MVAKSASYEPSPHRFKRRGVWPFICVSAACSHQAGPKLTCDAISASSFGLEGGSRTPSFF